MSIGLQITHVNDDVIEIWCEDELLLEVDHDTFDRSAMGEIVDLVKKIAYIWGISVYEHEEDDVE